MLVIRKEQLEAFEAAHAERFRRRLLDHVNRFFPERCAALGPGTVGEWVTLGLERARDHGFSAEQDLCKYLNLMFVLGADFDTSAQLPWARQLLASGGLPSRRLEALYTAALKHAEQTEDLEDA